MDSGKATAQEVAPLVHEISHAIRARRAHPPGHPLVQEAQQRCESAWRCLSVEARSFSLEVGEGGLSLDDGARIAGAGAAQLADELRVRRVRLLRIRGEPTSAELELLVEALAREPEALAHKGGLGALLRAAGARALEAVAATQDRNAGGSADAERSEFLTQQIADLVRRLSELEGCDDVASYNLAANKIEACVDVLVRAKRCMEAYRAALVLARHATDPQQRSDAIRREASDRLSRLARREDLLDAVIEQACGASGLASVQASQVLIAMGGVAVPRLLRQLDGRKDGTRARMTQLLIAFGDAALAPVVDELAAQQPDRARRAARLLGEMQNPRGVSFLADALGAPDVSLAREAAQALAKIGDDSALEALISGLALDGEVAETCAGCLGGLRQPASLPALYDVIDERRLRPESLRRAAIQSLGRIGNPASLACLKRILDHAPFLRAARYRGLRVAAAQAIAQIGGVAAVQALRAHERRGDPALRQACQEALRRLQASAARGT